MSQEMKLYVVRLLEAYRSDTQHIAILRYELAHPQLVLPTEMLEALALAKGDGGKGSAGYISDKTYYIAMNYQEKTESMNQENVSSISKELRQLEQKVSRLEHCVSQLIPAQQSVIKGIYFENKGLKNLAVELHLSERTLQRYKESAVDVLVAMYETLSKAGVSI